MPRRLLLWILGIPLVIGLVVSQAQPEERYYKEFTQFSQVLDIVKTRYVSEVETKKLFQGAYRGMLEQLDPYCQFFDAAELKEFKEETTGEFGGLGIEINVRDGMLTVITPIEDSPAWKAGILPGDRILYIDGKTTERITQQEAVRTLRGALGTKVTLTVRHPGSNMDTNITIVRATIKPKIVDSRILRESPKIGLIRIQSFTADMIAEFDKAAEAMNKQKIEGLVLDLRANPGGLLDAAVALADRFLEKGVIVSVKGRTPNAVYEAQPGGLFTNIPVIVLVDTGSASASEIAAAALQDNKRAMVVGMPSYGKGAVQNVIQIEGGAVKLTTAMYYTPSGKPITHEHPVEPDVTITVPVETMIALRNQETEDKMRREEKTLTEEKSKEASEGPSAEQNKPANNEAPAAPNQPERRKRIADVQRDGAVAILAAQIEACVAKGVTPSVAK